VQTLLSADLVEEGFIKETSGLKGSFSFRRIQKVLEDALREFPSPGR